MGLDICALIAADPFGPLGTADCDGGGIPNNVECFGPDGLPGTADDPAFPGDPANSDDDCMFELTCPGDITAADGCTVAPFTTAEDAGLTLVGCALVDVVMTIDDEIVPAECADGVSHFDSRDVIRTYTFVSSDGTINETCEQTITYEFSECNQVTDAGNIGINGGSLLMIPSTGCNVPAIEPTEDFVTSGCNDLVEHMWLVSTQERSNGSPFFPTQLNTGPEGSGSIWEIIDGATDPSFQPDVITQNTYYVRCTRSISCCDFVETNLVGYRIDEDAECPVIATPEPPAMTLGLTQDCEGNIILNVRDDAANGEQMEYRTNWTIEATNKVGADAHLIYNAKDGTTLGQGFEVQANAQFEVKTDGCDD